MPEIVKRNNETGQAFILCERCGSPIHYENATYEQDKAIEIDGGYICEDCITEYMLDNYSLKLKEE